MKFLITGGAGYIGSHFVHYARQWGHQVAVYDNLSRGHREFVPSDVPFYEADILDPIAMLEALDLESPDVVCHFAALALVGESKEEPERYQRINTEGVATLLKAMCLLEHIPKLVFSSTCAVFGTPKALPVSETDPKAPLSPYGESKLLAEEHIKEICDHTAMRAAVLRYFNACGAHETGAIGEKHDPETHLIPNVINAAIFGKGLTIHGSDFPTEDGTCIRDYIHVKDLCRAHLLAAEYLDKEEDGTFECFHLGTGRGTSNLEVVKAVERLSGKPINFNFGPARPGDPASLYADPSKAASILGFKAEHSSLDEIVSSALRWHQNQA